MLWAVLLIMVSCNKADDAVLEEASQVEANVSFAKQAHPLELPNADISSRPDDPFGIDFKVESNKIAFDYIVNTAHTPQINPTKITWTIDGNGQEGSSIHINSNFATEHTVTIDIEYWNGTLSSSFCFKRTVTFFGDPPPPHPLALCNDSGGLIFPFVLSNGPTGGGSAFTYIFPTVNINNGNG